MDSTFKFTIRINSQPFSFHLISLIPTVYYGIQNPTLQSDFSITMVFRQRHSKPMHVLLVHMAWGYQLDRSPPTHDADSSSRHHQGNRNKPSICD